MNRLGLWTLAVVCAALGAVTGYLGARTALSNAFARSQDARWDPVEVVVVTRELAAGETLDTGVLGRKTVPTSYVSDSSVRAEDARFVIGSRLIHSQSAGEMLRWTATSAGYPANACDQLREWWRAAHPPVGGNQAADGSSSP